MSSQAPITADAPPPELRYRHPVRPIGSAKELWRSRELIRVLAEREFQARYKQTVLGIVWALLSPVLLVIVFAVFVDRVADIETGDAPYILFAYIGLIPWNFFSFSLSRGGQSLVLDAGVINKVRCPREVFPLSGIASAGIDMVVSVFVLGALFVATGYELRTTAVWVPAIFVLQLAFVTGVVLVFAVLGVYFRDLFQAMPLLLQLGLLATPVAYGIEAIPERWWSVYAALDPLAAVIESYRQTMLYGYAPPWELVLPATASSAVWLVGGFLLFKKLEPGIADVA
jgi:ABC-2 type transport system permease protein/lipopolysaccharide transport system permease protein